MIKILLVDDNFELGFTLKELLELNGFKVEYVEDGFKALDKLKENNFELVIMDIVMPGIDGIETFRKMSEIRKNIKVIFISAFIDENRKKELDKIGVRDLIEKPYDFLKVINKIEELLSSNHQKEKEAQRL